MQDKRTPSPPTGGPRGWGVQVGGWVGCLVLRQSQNNPPPQWYKTGLRCTAARNTLNNVVMTMRL